MTRPSQLTIGLTSGAEQKREEAKPRIPGQAIKHKCRK